MRMSSKLISFILFSLYVNHSFAFDPTICPTLSVDEVKQVITSGRISTDRMHTLAVEANKTPAQVLSDEPTANPFDTYYGMSSIKKFNQQQYMIYVGNILAGSMTEATDRAQKILIGTYKTFSGRFVNGSCLYKEIEASSTIDGYPFKSKYENVVIVAYPACKSEFECKTIQTL